MTFNIGYRIKGTAPLYIIKINAESMCQAECKLNLLHCKNKLPYVSMHQILKIEFIRKKED